MAETITPAISIGIETDMQRSPAQSRVQQFWARQRERFDEREQNFEPDPSRAYHLCMAENAFRLIDDHHEMLRDRSLSEKLKMFGKMYFSAEVNRSLMREMEVRGALAGVLETAGQEYDDGRQ